MKNLVFSAIVTLACSAPLWAVEEPASRHPGKGAGGVITVQDAIPNTDCHGGKKIDPVQIQEDISRIENAAARQPPPVTPKEREVMGVFGNQTPLK